MNAPREHNSHQNWVYKIGVASTFNFEALAWIDAALDCNFHLLPKQFNWTLSETSQEYIAAILNIIIILSINKLEQQSLSI